MDQARRELCLRKRVAFYLRSWASIWASCKSKSSVIMTEVLAETTEIEPKLGEFGCSNLVRPERSSLRPVGLADQC